MSGKSTALPVTRLGWAIREERERRGLTQVEVAAMCGVTPGTVSNCELGVHRPRRATVLCICAGLGLGSAPQVGQAE